MSLLRIRRGQQRVQAGEVTDLQNPALWLREFALGRRTASNEHVTESTALGLPAYLAALRIVSGDVAKVVKRLHKRRPRRGSDIDEGHPVDDLLHDRFNPLMDAFNGWRVMVHRVMGWGAAPAEIVRDGSGRAVELWPIHPSRVTPRMQADGRTLKYEWQQKGFEPVTLDARDIFYLKGLGDGIEGYSVIRYEAETFGLGLAAQRHAAAFYGEGMAKRLVASAAESLDPKAIARLRKKIMGETDKDPESATPGRRKIPFIPADIKLHDAGIAPEDAQFIESMEFFGVADVSRITGCPLWLLSSDKTAKGWSSYDMQYQAYIDGTLVHHTEAIRGEGRLKLLHPSERRTHKIIVDFNSLMRANSDMRSKYLTSEFRGGALTRNERRRLNDLNPIEGDPNADRFFITKDLQYADELDDAVADATPEPTQSPTEEDRTDDDAESNFAAAAEALRPVFLDVAHRLVRKESQRLTAALKRNAANEARFQAWAEKFYADLRAEAVFAFGPPATAMMQLARVDSHCLDGWNPGAAAFDAGRAGATATQDPDERAAGIASAVFDDARRIAAEAQEENHGG